MCFDDHSEKLSLRQIYKSNSKGGNEWRKQNTLRTQKQDEGSDKNYPVGTILLNEQEDQIESKFGNGMLKAKGGESEEWCNRKSSRNGGISVHDEQFSYLANILQLEEKAYFYFS